MTSKEVRILIAEGDKGVAQLYKTHKKYFDLVDQLGDNYCEGDLLTEYELSFAMDRLTGCLIKLGSVASALESLVIRHESNYYLQEEKTFEKIRIQDKDHCKIFAKHKVSDLREYAGDFRSYFYGASSGVTTAQSRIKRISIEKGARRVDFDGDKSNVPTNTGDPLHLKPETNC